MLQSILDALNTFIRKVTLRQSVDDIVSDLQAKIHKLEFAADRQADEIQHQAAVIEEAEHAIAQAASEEARARILVERFTNLVAI